jgi:hypothetical protein
MSKFIPRKVTIMIVMRHGQVKKNQPHHEADFYVAVAFPGDGQVQLAFHQLHVDVQFYVVGYHQATGFGNRTPVQTEIFAV